MHIIQEILESEGVRVRSYSGRGMYGKSCLSADLDGHGLGEFIATVIEGAEDVDYEDFRILADAFRCMQTDSMGLGMIVYFPDVPYADSDDDSDDPE